MTRRQLAPALRALVGGAPELTVDGESWTRCAAELSALLAVARAAHRAWHDAQRITAAVEDLGDALHRLDRVSKGRS